MTNESGDIATVLSIYDDHPMRSGDAVLLLDGKVALEIKQLADRWDDVQRRKTAEVIRRTSTTVAVAVARPGKELLPSDFQLWRDLHRELREYDVQVAPLRAVAAA